MPYVQTRTQSQLFYTVSGSPSDIPIVFSNSLGTTHRMWDAVVDRLSVDRQCIRYDTRGHGASSRGAEHFEIADLAADVIDLLDELGLARVHFVGLSLGGMVGQALALHHGDRLTGLTLIATSAHMPPHAAWDARAELVRKEGMDSIVSATMERWFTPEFRDDPAVDAAREMLRAIDPQGYAACCEAIGRMDFRSSCARIRTPTSVIAGCEDPATPLPMLRELHNRIPGSRFVEISPGAHLVAIEQPARIAAEIRKDMML